MCCLWTSQTGTRLAPHWSHINLLKQTFMNPRIWKWTEPNLTDLDYWGFINGASVVVGARLSSHSLSTLTIYAPALTRPYIAFGFGQHRVNDTPYHSVHKSIIYFCPCSIRTLEQYNNLGVGYNWILWNSSIAYHPLYGNYWVHRVPLNWPVGATLWLVKWSPVGRISIHDQT